MTAPRDALAVPALVGTAVRLDPMEPGDAAGLFAAAGEPATFAWFSRRPEPWSVDGMRGYCAALLDDPTVVPFTVRDAGSGEVLGATAFCDIRPAHRGLEIGWTFYAPARRGTAVNPDAKRLLLRAAFGTPLFVPPVPGRPEPGPALRVMLKTGHHNLRSQRAIEKLGAEREGVLHNHIVLPDGTLRHTVVYAITPERWPRVDARLCARLGRTV